MATGMRAEVDLSINTTKAQRSMEKASAQLNKVMGGVGGKGANFKINERSFTQPLGRITGSANEFTKSLEASNARVIAFGASVGIINGVSNAFKNLVAETVKFEKTLGDINVVLNASNQSLEKFGSNLFDVAKNTAQSFDTAATAALEFSRQGLSMNEVLKRTNDALTLTRLTSLKAEEAVSGLTAAVNAFGDAGLTTTDIIDKLAAVDVKFAVSSEDLIKALERTGAVAIDAGVEIDSLIGLVAALQQTTARGGAVIGNGLKTIFTRIQRPETLNQLEQMDILVRDLTGSVMSADSILLNIARSFDRLTQSQQSNVVQFSAGIFQANVFRAALRDLAKEQSLQSKATEIAGDASGNAAVKNQQLNKTISALASQSVTAIQELAGVMGDLMLKPEVGGLLEFIKDGVEGLTSMLGGGEEQGSTFAKGLIRGIGNIITGPAAIAFGAVFIKLFMNVAKFARTSLKDVLGIVGQKDRIKETEESIIKALSSQESIQAGLNNLAGDHSAQESFILKVIEAQNNAMRAQQRLAQRLAPVVLRTGVNPDLTAKAVGTDPVDLDGDGRTDTFGSRGVLPSSARKERKEASRGGYSAGAVDSMSIKGLGKVVYNKAETVKQFPGMQQPAIMPPKQSRAGSAYKDAFSTKHGFDPYAAKGFVPNFAALNGDTLRLNQSKMHLYANPREAKPGGDAVRNAMKALVDSGKPVTVSATTDKLLKGEGGSHTKAIKGLIRYIADQEGGPKLFERDFKLTNLPWKGRKGEEAAEDAVAKALNKDGKKYINTGKRPGAHGDKTFPVDLIGEGLDPVEVKSGEWKQPNILLKSMRLYSDDELIQFAERQYGATPEMLKGARMEKLGKSARLLQGKGLLDKDASLEDQHNAALKYGIAGGFVPNFAYRGSVDREKLRRGLEKFIQDAGDQSEEELLELPSMKGLVGEVIDPNAHFTNLRDIINNKKNQGRTILQPEANKVEEITPEESQRLEGAIEKVRNIFNKKNKLEDSSVSKKAGEDFQDRIAIESGKTLDEVGAYDFPEGITGVAGVPDTKHPVDAAINGHNRNAMVNKAVRYVLAHQEKRDVLRRMIEGSRARGEINLDGLTGEVLEVLERQGVDGNTVSGTTGADQIKTKNMTEEEKSVVGLAQEKGVKFAGSYTQYSSAERPVVRPPGAASGFIPNFAGYTSAFRGTSPKYQKAIPDIPNPPQFLFDELMAAETKEKFLEAVKSLGRQHSMGKYSGSYNDNIRGATLGEIRGREKLGINEVHHGGYVYPRPVKGGLGTQGGVDISPAVQSSGFVSRTINRGVAEGFAKALVPGSQYDPELMGQVHESVIPNSRILNKERIEKYIDRYGLKAVKQSFKEGMKSGKLKDLHLNLHKFGKNEYGDESIGMSAEGLSRNEEEIAQLWGKNSPYYGEASGYVPNFVRWLPNPKGGPAMPAPDLDPVDGKPRGIYSGADVQEMRSKGYAYSDSKGWHYKGQAKGIGLAKTENNIKYMSGVSEPVSIRYLNSIKEFDRSKKSFLGWGQPGGDDRFSSLEELGSDMIKREVENALIIGYDSRQNMLQLIEGNHRLAAINEKNIAGDDNYATLPAYVSGTNIRGGNYGDGADYLKGITNRKGEPSRLPAEVEKYLRESESSGRPLRALQGRWKPSEFGIPNFADERTRKQKISDVLGDPSNAGINFKGGALRPRSIKSKNMFQKMWLESYFKTGLEGDYQMLMKMGYDPDTLLSLRSHAEKGGEVNILGKGFVPNFANPLREAIAREEAAGIPKSQIKVEQSGQLRGPGNPMGLAVTNKRDEPLGVGQGIRRATSMGIDPKRHGAADGLVPNFVGPRTRAKHGAAKKAARENETLRQGPIDPANLEKQASLAEQNNKLTAQEIAARKVLVDSLKKSTKAQKEATEADEKGTQETVDNTNEESQASSFGIEKLFFFQSMLSGANGFLQEFSEGTVGATKKLLSTVQALSDTGSAFIQQKAFINEMTDMGAIQKGEGRGLGSLFGSAREKSGKSKGIMGKVLGGLGKAGSGVMKFGKSLARFAPAVGQLYVGFTAANKIVAAFSDNNETLMDRMSSGTTRATKRLAELAKVSDEVTGSLEKLEAAEKNQEKIKELETKGIDRSISEEKDLIELRRNQLKLGKSEAQTLHRMAAMRNSNLTAERIAGDAFVELTKQGKSTTEALKGIEQVVQGASFAIEGLKSAQESINEMGNWDWFTDQEFGDLDKAGQQIVRSQFAIQGKGLFGSAKSPEEADFLRSTISKISTEEEEGGGIDEKAMQAVLLEAINSKKVGVASKGFLEGLLRFGEIMDDEADALIALKEELLKQHKEVQKQKEEQKKATISFEKANMLTRQFNADLKLRNQVFADNQNLEKKIQDNLRQEKDIRSKILKDLGVMAESTFLREQFERDAVNLDNEYSRKKAKINQEQLNAQSKIAKDLIKQGSDTDKIKELNALDNPLGGLRTKASSASKTAGGATTMAGKALADIPENIARNVKDGEEINYVLLNLAIEEAINDFSLTGDGLKKFIEGLKGIIGVMPTQGIKQELENLEVLQKQKVENLKKERAADEENLRLKHLEVQTQSNTLAGAILKGRAMEKSADIFDEIVKVELGLLENAKLARKNSFNALSMWYGNRSAGEGEVVKASQGRVDSAKSAAKSAQAAVSEGVLLDKFRGGATTMAGNPLNDELENLRQPILGARIEEGTKLKKDLFTAEIENELRKNAEEELARAILSNQIEEQKIQSDLTTARFKLLSSEKSQAIYNAEVDRLELEKLTLASELDGQLLQQQIRDENKKELDTIRKLTDLKEQAVKIQEAENILQKAKISKRSLGREVTLGRIQDIGTRGRDARSAMTLANQTGRSEDALSAAQKIQEYNRAAGKASEATDHLRVRMAELAVSEDMLAVELIDVGLDGVKSGWQNVFETIANGSKDADEAWKDFGLNIIKKVLDKFTEKNIEKIIANLTYAFTGVGGPKDLEKQKSGIVGDVGKLEKALGPIKDEVSGETKKIIEEVRASTKGLVDQVKPAGDALETYGQMMKDMTENSKNAFNSIFQDMKDVSVSVKEAAAHFASAFGEARIKAEDSARDAIMAAEAGPLAPQKDIGLDKNWQSKDQSHMPNSVWAEIDIPADPVERIKAEMKMKEELDAVNQQLAPRTPPPDKHSTDGLLALLRETGPSAGVADTLLTNLTGSAIPKNALGEAGGFTGFDLEMREKAMKYGDLEWEREQEQKRIEELSAPTKKLGEYSSRELDPDPADIAAMIEAQTENTQALREATEKEESLKSEQQKLASEIIALRDAQKAAQSKSKTLAEKLDKGVLAAQKTTESEKLNKQLHAKMGEQRALPHELLRDEQEKARDVQLITEIDELVRQLAELNTNLKQATTPGNLPNGSDTGGSFLGGKIQKFNKGGLVDGPAGVDQVPAMLTKGEFVIPRKNVDKMFGGGTAGEGNGGIFDTNTDNKYYQGAHGLARAATMYAVTKAMSDKKPNEPPKFNKQRLESLDIGSDINMTRGDPRMSGRFLAQDPVLEEYRGHMMELAQYKVDKKNAKYQEKLGLLTSIHGAVTSMGISMATEMVADTVRKGISALTGWAKKKWQGAKNWAGEKFGKHGGGFTDFKGQLSGAGISTDGLNYSDFASSMETGDAFSYGNRMYEPENGVLSQQGTQVFQDIGRAPTEGLYSGELQAPKQMDAHVGSYWNDQTANWLQGVDAAQKSRTRRFNAYVAPTVEGETDKRALGGMTGGSLPTMLTAGEGFVPAPIAQRIGYNNLNHMNSTGEIPTIQGEAGRDKVGPVGLSEGDFIIRKSSTDKLLNNNPNMMRFAMQNPDGFRRGEQGYYEGGIVGGSELTMPASSLTPQGGEGATRGSMDSGDRQGSSVEKTATGSSETTNNISINVSIDGTGAEKSTEAGDEGSYEEERTLSLKIKSAVLDVIRQEKRIGGELS